MQLTMMMMMMVVVVVVVRLTGKESTVAVGNKTRQ